ncbi:hypothetical protein CR513_15664, partial [Mucuna pruriens]
MQSHVQTPLEEPENGVERGMPGSLRKGQTVLGNTFCPHPDNTRETPNPLPDSVGRINGLRFGATRRLKKERISHILSQQEIHILQTKVPNAGANLLRSNLEGEKVETIHAGPYYARQTPSIYTSQKAIKGSALAKQLAHHPLDDYQPLLYDFPNEHIISVEEARSASKSARWKLWFDGAWNLLGNEIGAVLASLKEYEAKAMGIMMAIERQVKKLKVFDH